MAKATTKPAVKASTSKTGTTKQEQKAGPFVAKPKVKQVDLEESIAAVKGETKTEKPKKAAVPTKVKELAKGPHKAATAKAKKEPVKKVVGVSVTIGKAANAVPKPAAKKTEPVIKEDSTNRGRPNVLGVKYRKSIDVPHDLAQFIADKGYAASTYLREAAYQRAESEGFKKG